MALQGEAGANTSKLTIRSYSKSIWQMMQHVLTPINLISNDEMRGWIADMQKRGLMHGTVRLRFIGVKRLFCALRWCGLPLDPCSEIRPPRDPVAPWDKREPYSEEEIECMRKYATGCDLLIVLLGAHAGLRSSEMLALKWHHIDLRRHTLQIQGKGQTRRLVPMSRSLCHAVSNIRNKEPDAFIFPFRSTRSTYLHLEKIVTKLGIPNRGVHALRHSAGTRIMKETGSIQDTARMLGHANLETARIYAKWSDESVRKAVGHW